MSAESALVRDREPGPDQPTLVFLALKPAPPDSRQMFCVGSALAARRIIAGRQVAAPRLHLTLLPVWRGHGRMPSAPLAQICDAIDAVRFPRFEIVMDRVIAFGAATASRPVVMIEGDASAAPIALSLALQMAIEVRSLPAAGRAARVPHVTLLWGDGPARAIPVEPSIWRADRIQLVESWRGKATHVSLASWQLA